MNSIHQRNRKPHGGVPYMKITLGICFFGYFGVSSYISMVKALFTITYKSVLHNLLPGNQLLIEAIFYSRGLDTENHFLFLMPQCDICQLYILELWETESRHQWEEFHEFGSSFLFLFVDIIISLFPDVVTSCHAYFFKFKLKRRLLNKRRVYKKNVSWYFLI